MWRCSLLHVTEANTPAADEDQKLLLYIDYVCTEKDVALPWDSIAATMEPRDAAKGERPMTGEAIKQHLAKLRDHRAGEGHAVPPKLERGARRSLVGKNTPSTPAPSPRKASGFGGPPTFPKMVSFGRGKAQGPEKETPMKKGSSLVAPVSKSKQKKAEKAKREALLSSGSGDLSLGGKLVEAITGKRGRRQAAAAAAFATEDEDRYDTPSSGVPRGRQSHRPERKHYTGTDSDLAELGIKNEPESEDDLPLSKRRNTGQTLEGKKKTATGLMGDAARMWQNRNGKPTIDGSAAQSPQVHQSIEQVVRLPSTSNRNNQERDAGLSQATLSGGNNYQKDFPLPQTTVGGNPNETSFAFNPVNYQGHPMHSRLDQERSSDAYNALYLPIESAYPSPMDYSIAEYQALRRTDGAPGHIFVPRHSNNYTGQLSNDHPLTSSPAFDSSTTFPGSDVPQSASRNNSTNTSFSSTQGLQDPYAESNSYFAGLPIQGPQTMGSWSSQPAHTAAETGFDAGHQYPGYTDSQAASGCVNPTFITPTSGLGLGISQSHSGGNNFELSAETKDDHAYLDQPGAPTFGMPMGNSDLVDPHDSFLGMAELYGGSDFLNPLPGINFDA